MNTCKSCQDYAATVNKKGYCLPCEELEISYVKQNVSGKSVSDLNYHFNTQDMKEFASILNIKGRSKMNKVELCEAVKNAMNEIEAAEAVEVAPEVAPTIKGYTCEECKNETTDFENIGDHIFCNDCMNKEGYCIVNYHTGEELNSLELGPLFNELKQLENSENTAGFYKVLKVEVMKLQNGSTHYFKADPIEEHEVKTAAEVKEILIQWNQAATVNEDNEEEFLVENKLNTLLDEGKAVVSFNDLPAFERKLVRNNVQYTIFDKLSPSYVLVELEGK